MDLKKLPKTEFAAAVAQIAGVRGVDPQFIVDSVELGLISAYKRDQREKGIEIPEEDLFAVELDPDTGSFKIFNITDSKAKKDVTPPGFGRIAAQTAMQVINQKINEGERDTILGDYEKKLGTLVSGSILKVDSYKVVIGINKTEGILPRDEQIRGETFTLGAKKLFLVKGIQTDAITGKKDVILSRRDPEFVRQLFIREVPEVGNKTVKIERIARSAGDRSKVAVSSSQGSVDPVGSCIGQKGSRIQAILNELPASEKVDVVLFAKNINQFIVNAMSPASGVSILELNKDTHSATISVPDDQLALAIGSEGSNVRLAGELVGGYEIKVIKSDDK